MLAKRSRWSIVALGLAVSACTQATREPAEEGSTAQEEEAPAAQEPEVRSATGLRASMDSLRSELIARIGDPTASSVAACRALPVGKKACGGPSFYLVYSVQTADSAELARLAGEVTELQEQVIRQERLLSDCQVEPTPKLVLQGGRCAAGSQEIPGLKPER